MKRLGFSLIVIVFLIFCVSNEGQTDGMTNTGRLTISMNHYNDMRILGDNISFDPVERGRGIKTYSWEIYPEKLIENAKKKFFKKSPINGRLISMIWSPGHVFTGLDDTNMNKAKTALSDGEPVRCSTTGPMRITLPVPAGRYYIDYWFNTRRNVLQTDKIAPMQYFRDPKYRDFNWGPYEILISPGGHQEIICTPNGKNSCEVYDELNWFLSYLVLGSRNAWMVK